MRTFFFLGWALFTGVAPGAGCGSAIMGTGGTGGASASTGGTSTSTSTSTTASGAGGAGKGLAAGQCRTVNDCPADMVDECVQPGANAGCGVCAPPR